jgi:RNA polymerase sigma-70 factor (ECF subfamily)
LTLIPYSTHQQNVYFYLETKSGVLNQQAFQQLFDRYFERVRNYIFYRCGDPELATDITQDTFMRIWEKRLKPDKGKEKALLFKIAGDILISDYRKKQSALRFAEIVKQEQKNPSADHEMDYKELKANYERTLSQMNEKQRVVFLMSRYDGLKYREIAEHLDISVKAVEKRMNQALDHLKKHLKNE